MSTNAYESHRRGAWFGAALLACLGGCNSLFGIDEADVSPAGSGAGGAGGAAGTGGATGTGGAAGMGATGGAAGMGGAAGASGGGGEGPTGPGLDETFGTKGVVTTDLGGQAAKAFSVATLQALPSGALAVTGSYEFLAPEAFDQGDAFVARFDAAGALDPTFASDLAGQEGFQSGQGVMFIDRTVSSDRVIGAHVDEAKSSVIVRLFHADTESGTFFPRLWHAETRAAGSSLLAYGNGGDADVLSTYVFASSAGDRFYRAMTPGDFVDHVGFVDVVPATPPPSPPPPGNLVDLPTDVVLFTPIVATASGGFVHALATSIVDSRVGVVRFTEGAEDVALDLQFASDTGFAAIDQAALGLDSVSGGFGVATDEVRNVYAGFTGTSAVVAVPRSVVVKVKADGSGLDPSFGSLGVLDPSPEGQASWACLVLDPAGDLVVAGTRDGTPRALRFSAQGVPDPAFGPEGIALPFPPQRCAIDAAGRLVFAGEVGSAVRATLALARLRLD